MGTDTKRMLYHACCPITRCQGIRISGFRDFFPETNPGSKSEGNLRLLALLGFCIRLNNQPTNQPTPLIICTFVHLFFFRGETAQGIQDSQKNFPEKEVIQAHYFRHYFPLNNRRRGRTL